MAQTWNLNPNILCLLTQSRKSLLAWLTKSGCLVTSSWTQDTNYFYCAIVKNWILYTARLRDGHQRMKNKDLYATYKDSRNRTDNHTTYTYIYHFLTVAHTHMHIRIYIISIEHVRFTHRGPFHSGHRLGRELLGFMGSPVSAGRRISELATSWLVVTGPWLLFSHIYL